MSKKLIFLNYRFEISVDIMDLLKDKFTIFILNENKWYNFAFKMQKILLWIDFKPDLVIHRWICGAKDNSDIWNIYQIQRSFLYNDEHKILESQKHRFSDDINLAHKANIVTKFSIQQHDKMIYDFAFLYDLETFWVWQLTNFFSFPIITLKWVTDTNKEVINLWTEDKEIEFLLNTNLKRQKRQLILEEIWHNINLLSNKLLKILEEFL